jgi:hypothetical protein
VTTPPPPSRKRPPKTARAETPRAQPLDVKLHVRFSAQVTVDGKPAGNNNMFDLKLAPGLHRVLVHHACCKDALQDVVVNPTRPEQLYQLEYGDPLPAQFKVLNAPPGARVLIGDLVIGTAADPRPYSMTDPDQQVSITIGERTLVKRIKAGQVNLLDYAQAAP